MNVEQFEKTVALFVRDGSVYVNTQTGQRLYGGVVTFAECRHSYTYRPWAAQHNLRRGHREMCALCIEAALESMKAEAVA